MLVISSEITQNAAARVGQGSTSIDILPTPTLVSISVPSSEPEEGIPTRPTSVIEDEPTASRWSELKRRFYGQPSGK